MVTTTPCDNGHHGQCPGEGLVLGLAHHPHDLNRDNWWKQWVTVSCGCPCHASLSESSAETPSRGQSDSPL